MEQKNLPAIFGGAKYIKATEEAPLYSLYDPLPLFRKEFRIDAPFGKAEIAVQAPGFGKFFLNGAPITENIFYSATSDYDKILWFDVYDVTHLLKEGANALFAVAGNGFLNESFPTAWYYDSAPWRDAPQFLLCLLLDGKPFLWSDDSWRVSREESPILFSHLRSGETVDMRKWDPQRMLAGYDDSRWEKALVRTRPLTAEFKETPCPPVKECKTFSPVSVTALGDGAYLADFGQNISGYAEITLSEEAGQKIALYYAEEVDREGRPKHNGMDGKHYYPQTPFQKCTLIASGKKDTWRPDFAYFGFRYLRVEGLTKAPRAEELTAIWIHQDIARRSKFTSGSDVLNFIYDAGIAATYSNLFWCLTDCPTREKLGWTNDAQASTEQTLYNFDILPLYEKWFEDIKASMFPDGSLHGTVPSTDWPWGHACGPVCDGLLYEMPWKVYLYMGKTKMLLEGLPYFERYAAFLEKKIEEGHKFELGDWSGAGSSAEVPVDLIARMYLVKAADVTAFAKKLSGEDASLWEEKAKECRLAVAKLALGEDGRARISAQTLISMLLSFGIGDRAVLAEQLCEVIEGDGFMLQAGMVGIQYIYSALFEIGRGDLAFRLLTDSDPGYRTWMNKGATTLWERWAGEDDGSHNHHMFSGVIACFFRYLLGIAPCPDAPAFDRLECKPCLLSEVGFAEGELETPKGKILARWQAEEDGFVYTVTLPEGIRATFRGEELRAGENVFRV